MIESITITKTASYDDTPNSMPDLSSFNYVFGANATGKTTISRIIADENLFPTCKVHWRSNTKLQTLVYNRDFVDNNFDQSKELKGVFTLGEESVELIQKIATAKGELVGLVGKIEGLEIALNGGDKTEGKREELASVERTLQRKCWSQKQKHDSTFKHAFTGVRDSQTKFKDKVLAEQKSNASALLTLDELKAKAATVFDQTPTVEQVIPQLTDEDVLSHESDPILPKNVIGKNDVDIAKMIKKLGNSDWVKKGLPHYENNDGYCPFCQQLAPEGLQQSFEQYFDEEFEEDIESIKNLIENYDTDAKQLLGQIDAVIDNPGKHLDVEKFKQIKETLKAQITSNQQLLEAKKKEPSRSIALKSLSKTLEDLKNVITNANILISKNNEVVANLEAERKDLTSLVWKFLIGVELKDSLQEFTTKSNQINKAIESMSRQIRELSTQKAAKEQEIRELEKQTTSTQPTIDTINTILQSFGFKSFSLAAAGENNCYKLLRPDGTDAKSTLSEGERTFITFLYFYHLLKGSNSESGITNDRIVVFDDPVSSLDSDILFIVSNLIKGLFDDIRNGQGYIKQVFVLTHNVYFFKEVTFSTKRNQATREAMREETFWVINKPDLKSKIIKHCENPIRTSYELLWQEVKNTDRPNHTIQNTLRRILENYFKILGGIDPDEICGKFDGKEKFVCKSLFSWVNDGSHYVNDDLYMTVGDITVEMYLEVFHSIFIKMGHEPHYNMMICGGRQGVGSHN